MGGRRSGGRVVVQHLPPLKSIEAFVSVAETLSYAKAAHELSITKSAISRRIQSLETDLGVRLLRRTNKAPELTPDGAAYFKITGPAFGALRTAADALERTRRNNVLRIALPQSFASHWFIPRLPSFYKQHPQIDLQLDSLGYFDSLNGDNIDVVLQVAKEPNRTFHAEKFMKMVQFPVCSPEILKRSPVSTVDDLAAHTILHLKTMPDAWAQWLALAGRPGLTGPRTQHFDTMSLSLEAAANGLGFAMGVEMLCREDIASGRLAAPLPQRLEEDRAMYFVCRKQDVSSRLVRQFRAWLMAEALR
jgi:LysR family glycine cleavage system transcriptional activator